MNTFLIQNSKKILRVVLGTIDSTKYLIYVILLLAIFALPVQALTYKQAGFIVYVSPDMNWIFITPESAYFSKWLGEDLGTIGEDGSCIIIRGGEVYNCTLQEFSILLYYFPTQLITELKSSLSTAQLGNISQ